MVFFVKIETRKMLKNKPLLFESESSSESDYHHEEAEPAQKTSQNVQRMPNKGIKAQYKCTPFLHEFVLSE